MNLEIANRLQQLRKEKGFSQEELAEKLNVSRQAVSKWERGEAIPDTDNLILLAKIYDISIDTLLGVKEQETISIAEEQKKEPNKKKNIIFDSINGILVLIIVITYILLGSIFNLWHPGWLVFLLIPIFISIFEAIRKKRFAEFSFPVLVTLIYLLLGFEFNLWHPFWFLFILIPGYYILADLIDKSINK